MTRPAEFLAVLENDDASPVKVADEQGELILQLLVHMFFADEELHDKEVALLQRIVGGEARALRDQIVRINATEMDWGRLAKAFPERKDRLDIIEIAEHGFWADNQMKFSEMDVLDKLADVFGIEDR